MVQEFWDYIRGEVSMISYEISSTADSVRKLETICDKKTKTEKIGSEYRKMVLNVQMIYNCLEESIMKAGDLSDVDLERFESVRTDLGSILDPLFSLKNKKKLTSSPNRFSNHYSDIAQKILSINEAYTFKTEQ